MIKRIGRLVLGENTINYFLALTFFTIIALYLVPIKLVVLYDNVLLLIMLGGVIWLSSLFVFSFKTNPTAFNGVIRWFFLVAICSFLCVTIAKRYGTIVGEELVNNGVTTEATIINKEAYASSKSDVKYNVTVQFKDEHLVSRTETFKTSEETFSKIYKSQEVRIRYSRDFPNLIRIVSTDL